MGKRMSQSFSGNKTWRSCSVTSAAATGTTCRLREGGHLHQKSGTWEEFELAYDVPMRVDMFQKPNWHCQQTQGIQNLAEVYKVMQWRREERAQQFRPYPKMREDVVFIAAQRFPDLHNQVTREQQSWPLSTLRTTFVLEGRQRGVGREALILACMLEAEAVTFIPQKRSQNMGLLFEKVCRWHPSRKFHNGYTF